MEHVSVVQPLLCLALEWIDHTYMGFNMYIHSSIEAYTTEIQTPCCFIQQQQYINTTTFLCSLNLECLVSCRNTSSIKVYMCLQRYILANILMYHSLLKTIWSLSIPFKGGESITTPLLRHFQLARWSQWCSHYGGLTVYNLLVIIIININPCNWTSVKRLYQEMFHTQWCFRSCISCVRYTC